MTDNQGKTAKAAAKTTVLCIEDEPEMIDLFRVILERKGYRVVGAVGGQEGLKALETCTPDLILLDLMMPDVDGWEVFRQVRANARLK